MSSPRSPSDETEPTEDLPPAACAPLRLALRTAGRSQLALPRRGCIVLGSRSDTDLHLEDPYVSGRHAEIRVDELGPRIEDLGSTNGTWVDGVRVRQAWLEPGTSIRLGHRELEVVAADKAARAGSRAGLEMVGRSPAFFRLLAATRKLAPLRQPVLIHGETGTGKELVARALHELGGRRRRRFVAVNCAAIPEPLAESQLFGHVRGAFTGASRPHTGAFLRAHTGTLLLDEVGELPLPVQAKLLRVLETHVISPVGSEHEIPVDVRIVSATHRPLDRMMDTGHLREDLFHRLSVFVVQVPALRDRPQDIPPLVDLFLAQAGHELGREVSITKEALEAARRGAWPGNIRALRNAILRAAVLADGPITSSDLLAEPAVGPTPTPSLPGASRDAGAIYVPRGDYASMQRDLLRQVVAEAGSIRQAAKVLGVPRSTLGTWLRRRS